MTTLHPFSTSQESVLPIWSLSVQLWYLVQPDTQTSPFAHSTLNPFLSVILTFLATITMMKHTGTLSALEHFIPWHNLTQFFATIPGETQTSKRWTWIVRSALCLSSVVDGFTWAEDTWEWRVANCTLEAKLRQRIGLSMRHMSGGTTPPSKQTCLPSWNMSLLALYLLVPLGTRVWVCHRGMCTDQGLDTHGITHLYL
jgi:hypothetical protein